MASTQGTTPAEPRRRTVGRTTVTLLILLGVMIGLRALMGGVDWPSGEPRGTTVAVGFLLLAAFIGGRLSAELGAPRITGYIVIGALVGPSLLGLVTDGDLSQLELINDIAISLIALAAGGELKLSELRRRGRSMLGIMGFEMVAVFVVVAGAVVLLSPVLPFTAGREFAAIATIALIFGSIAIANSPSVAIAVITDTRSRGPVSSTILGVTVMKDVAVILSFAVALSIARSVLSPEGGFETDFFLSLAWEIGGSILLGAVSGWIVSLYLQKVRAGTVLFVLAMAFLNAEIAAILHLEVLILSMTAGFFIENISPAHGEPFVEALEANALPVYALFFALAGAGIHLAELAELWPIAVGFVLARAAAVFGGTWLGSRVTGAEPEVRRYAWLGFISQAGVTLGMVIIAARAFPEWGAELQTLFVSMVAIHELVGPILLQYGLDRAGELGRRDAPPAPVVVEAESGDAPASAR
ncbi:MAG: cation:proton antiporter [Gemmatimonadota bacterium]